MATRWAVVFVLAGALIASCGSPDADTEAALRAAEERIAELEAELGDRDAGVPATSVLVEQRPPTIPTSTQVRAVATTAVTTPSAATTPTTVAPATVTTTPTAPSERSTTTLVVTTTIEGAQTTTTTTSTPTSTTGTTTPTPTTTLPDLTIDDVSIDLFVIESQCFNTAGATVTVEPDVSIDTARYDGRETRVVYEILGGEAVERFHLTLEGDSYSYEEHRVSTPTCSDTLTARVVDVRSR